MQKERDKTATINAAAGRRKREPEERKERDDKKKDARDALPMGLLHALWLVRGAQGGQLLFQLAALQLVVVDLAQKHVLLVLVQRGVAPHHRRYVFLGGRESGANTKQEKERERKRETTIIIIQEAIMARR